MLKAKEFYDPKEITACPSCGSKNKDPVHVRCWHCADCGFAICAYVKDQVDEIRRRCSVKRS